MSLTQKQTRAISVLDAIKLEATHHLGEKEKSAFAIQIEKFKVDARKSDSALPGMLTHLKTYITPMLKRLPDDVKSKLHQLDLIIHGRR